MVLGQQPRTGADGARRRGSGRARRAAAPPCGPRRPWPSRRAATAPVQPRRGLATGLTGSAARRWRRPHPAGPGGGAGRPRRAPANGWSWCRSAAAPCRRGRRRDRPGPAASRLRHLRTARRRPPRRDEFVDASDGRNATPHSGSGASSPAMEAPAPSERSIVQQTAVPSMATTPSPRTTRVDSVVIGLSSRTAVTSTSPVMVSPGRAGARNRQWVSRKTVPGPGSRSATTALRIALVTPPCTTMPPNRVRAASSSS